MSPNDVPAGTAGGRIAGRDAEADTRALLELAGDLAAAATPTEVAHALVERLPPLVGATGGALGLIQDGELVIVDPGRVSHASLPANLRLPLEARAPIAHAARTGQAVFANSRAEFEREFPDGAGLASYAESALAVPLVAGDRVVGSMGFPFTETGAVDTDLIGLALLAAALGGQALERSQLYEREHLLRAGLDRIARLAPRFAGESAEAILELVCREARITFDAEAALVWLVDGDDLVLERTEPAQVAVAGHRLARRELPQVEESLEHRAPTVSEQLPPGSFPPLAERTTLQVPIVLGGRVARILTAVLSPGGAPPSQETLVLARRLADHAELALEHAAYEEARHVAESNALQTRRLLDATTALAAASTPELVGAATLAEATTTLGAAAGVVVRRDGDELVVLAAEGFTDGELAPLARFPASADVPLADAVRRGAIVTHESPEALARDYPEIAESARRAAWLSAPLTAGGGIYGALGLAFAEPRSFDDGELAYVASLSRQAGQALDRAVLYEEERRARERAERLATDLTRLHAFATSLAAATSTEEIGELVCQQVKAMLGADTCAVYEPGEGEAMSLLRAAGDADDPLWPTVLERSLHPSASVWLASEKDWAAHAEYTGLRRERATHAAVLPLSVSQEPAGTLVAWFPEDGFPEEGGRRLLETMVRQATQPLDRLRLLQSERRARLEAQTAVFRTQTLYEVADRLSVAVTPTDVAEVLCAAIRGVLAADEVEVFAIDAAEARADLLASSADDPERTVPLGSLELEPTADDRPGADQGRTSISVPLVSGVRTPGAVRLTFDTPVVLDGESEAMLQAIARQGGQALDRSRLYEEELLARTRTERLQSLTAAFSGALTLDDVATTFVTDTLQALEADGVYLGVVDANERELESLAWRGYEEAVARECLGAELTANVPTAVTVRTGRPAYYERVEDLWSDYPEFAAAVDELGHGRFAFLPVRVGTATLGVALVSWVEPAPLHSDVRAFLEAFATQCGLALDRATRYDAERSVAETLQRSLLPDTVPVMEGARVAARYVPGTSALDVGGDWFDTLSLADGRLGFVVGDVVGKGLRAASTMAQLRNGLRALTLDETDVARTVTNLNRLLESLTDAPFATLVFLAVEPATGEATLVSAGHLPPLVVAPGREPVYLEEGRNLPLGVDPELAYEAWTTTLAPGSLVLLYTDGLVERPEESIDEGLRRLAAVAGTAERDPEPVADVILAELLGERRLHDDVALLVLELAGARARQLDLTLPARPESLVRVRDDLAEWLEEAHVPETDARDVLLAAWEAAANGIEHARADDGGTVRVTARIVGDRICVDVSDVGTWKEARARDDRGLGLRIMRALMTEVEVERSADGTHVRMERSVSVQVAASDGRGDHDDD